jgi:hypothetical protein
MNGKYMRRGLIVLAAMVLTSLAWAGGGEPWNGKPYQQWNDADINRVLHLSPWSHNVVTEQTWRPLGIADLVTGDSGTAGSHTSPSGGGAKGTGTYMAAEHDSNAYTRGPDAHFDVYWSSSQTIRKALAQRAVLHNGNDAKQAEDFVNAAQDDYQVLVQGTDMAPFQRKDEKEYATMAWLQLKGSKDKIMPVHVTYTRDDKNAVTGAAFYFAKKTASGSPTIPDGTKTADFYCKVGASTIHAGFEIQKMQNEKGVDL